MTKHSCLKFIILLLITAGCIEKKEYKYSVEMKPLGGAVERKLVCTGDFSNEALERIAGLYENRVNRHTFSGTFDANLPNDVGGAGFYMSFISDMGKTTVYSERFQGDDDLYAKLDQMGPGVDQLIDLVIGWLEYELGRDPNFGKLREFCDNNLRQDCKNLSCYLWLGRVLSEYHDEAHHEFSGRAIHYLLEREYIGQKELLLLSQGSEKTVYNVVHRIVAGKMGYSDPNVAAERLKFLSDAQHFEKSISRYIPTTDLYKNLWERRKIEEADPNAEPPETGEVLCSVLERTWFDFDLFAPTYTIEVKLTCDSEPLVSNGRWDAEAQQIVWSDTIGNGPVSIVNGPSIPTYFYGSWSIPDKEFQEEHFGRVILSDEALAEYCMRQKVLDEKRLVEWNAFIASLKPDQNIEELVGVFRFSDDWQAEEDDSAEKLCKLILAGLKSEQEKQDDTKTRVDKE